MISAHTRSTLAGVSCRTRGSRGGARATLGEAGERKAGAARWPSGVCWGRSSEFAVFAQQGDQVGESLSGGGVGVELEFELGQSAAILASSSASRAFSLLSCAISFSMSGLRRQLSVDKNERHRGSDAPDAPLLREREGAGGEGDVVIGGEQSDQGDHNSADGLDPALAIKNADGWGEWALWGGR